MTRYRIEEESDTPDFWILAQIILCVIFLPIGIIVGAVKLINYFSDKKKENELKNHHLHSAKMNELQNLAALKQQGLITDAEYFSRREKIMKHL